MTTPLLLVIGGRGTGRGSTEKSKLKPCNVPSGGGSRDKIRINYSDQPSLCECVCVWGGGGVWKRVTYTEYTHTYKTLLYY